MAAIRPRVRRRGDARVVTLGYLTVGGSAFVLLAVAPRLLGEAGYSGVALIWVVATLFGIGIASPTEQVINRRLNAGAPSAVGMPVRALVGAGVLAGIACLALAPRSAAAAHLDLLTPGMVLPVIGWVLVAPVRGRIVGAGDLIGYSAVLLVESTARVLLVALALLWRSQAAALLVAAAGLPLVLAGLAGLLLRTPAPDGAVVGAPGPDPQVPPEGCGPGGSAWTEQAAFVLVSVGYQACLNGAPLLVEWRFGHALPAVVGAFVSATTYFRTPSLVAGGVLTHALVSLSHAWGAGDLIRFRAARTAALRQILLVTVPLTLLVAVVSPVVLPLFYGHPVDLPVGVLLALPVSTVVAVVAAAGGQILLSAGRGGAAAGLWVLGAVVTGLLLTVSSGLDGWFAAGLVLGPAVTLAGSLLVERRLIAPAPVAGRVLA